MKEATSGARDIRASEARWLEFNFAMAFLTLRLPRLLNYDFMGAQSEERSDA
jgi:hypothetical protein